MKLKSKICKFFCKESKLFVCWLIFRGYCYGVKEPNLCNLLCALRNCSCLNLPCGECIMVCGFSGPSCSKVD